MLVHRSLRVLVPASVRGFSTPAGKIQRTPEQIKEGLAKVEQFRKLQRPTSKHSM